MKIFNSLFLLLLLSSCSHSPINTKLSKDWAPLKLSKQKKLVRKHTKTHQEYDGLHLSYKAEITFLSSSLQSNNLKVTSQFKNWTQEVADSNKNKQSERLSKNVEFFLTFYSPQTKRNKLNQKAADWKAVLKVDNSEYEGTIQLRENRSHHNKAYYPNLDPWSTPYLVSFPVSTKTLGSNKFTVVILGPEGMATFKY